MDYILWLSAIWCAFEAANLNHWRFRPGEKWQYIPTTGVAAKLNWATHALVFVMSILFIVGLVPFLFLGIPFFASLCASDIYSIVTRDRIRRDPKLSKTIWKYPPIKPGPLAARFSITSSDANAILAHMTSKEQAWLFDANLKHLTDVRIVIPMLIIFPLVFASMTLAWPMSAALWSGFVIVNLVLLYFWTKRVYREHRVLLCQTEWARTQGFTPENLKLTIFSSPKQKQRRIDL